MKTSECSFCGILTSSDKSICDSCDAAFSAMDNSADSGAVESNNFQEFPAADFGVQSEIKSEIKSENSENAFQPSFAQSSDSFQSPRTSRPPRPNNAPRSSCVLCHRQIPAAQKVCFQCSNKKLPLKKFVTAFTVLAVLAIAGIGVYAYKIYVENSPLMVLKKYEIATGADKMAGIQNFSFKGKTAINITAGPANPNLARTINESFSFELILQNPNKSYMAFFKTDPADASKKEIVYKQAFDGFNGWKYAKMFNQPPTLEDDKGVSKGAKPEIFLSIYDSVEYLNDKIKAEYGEEDVESLMSISSYTIDGIVTTSKSRVGIQVEKNGEKTLLVFDKEKNLLLGMLKKDIVEDTPRIATIYVDNYKTLTVKGKNSEDVSGLMPNRWKFEMHEAEPKEAVYLNLPKVKMSMTMTLDIETIETNSAVEDKIFFKPISVYSVDNRGY